MTGIVVKITDEEYKSIEPRSRAIANLRYKDMKKRGHNTTPTQNRHQFLLGHLAEYCVYKHFKNTLNRECTLPDYDIRQQKDRRHDADLISGNLNVSVKCDGSFKYSWAFNQGYINKYNMMYEDFLNKYDIMVPVHSIDERTYEIVGIYTMKGLIDGGMFAPSKKEFKKPKLCLYYEDCIVRNSIQVNGIKNFRG